MYSNKLSCGHLSYYKKNRTENLYLEAPDPGEENKDLRTDNQENQPPNFVPDTPAQSKVNSFTLPGFKDASCP